MQFKSFNEDHLLKHFSGDEEILLDMIDTFESSLLSLLSPIRESIQNKNADQLRINAHTFKGIMRNFYAGAGVDMAHQLEQRGLDSKFEDTLSLLNRLEDQLVLFVFELDTLKKSLNKFL